MNEKDQFDFTLEDILKEFGSGTGESAPETPAENSPAPEAVSDAPETPAAPEKAEPEAATEEPAPAVADVPAEVPPEAPAESAPETPAEPVPEAPAAEADPADEDEDFTSDFWNAIRNAPLVGEDAIAAAAPTPEPPAEEQPEPPAGEDPEDPDADMRIYYENPDYKEKPVLGATRRFSLTADTITPASTNGDTIRLDTSAVTEAVKPAKTISADTVVFTPLGENAAPENTEESAPAPVPEGAEPFSKNWEPHYEEPMGEYVPPEPIVFRPRSRLSELKKKLVAGPERRYYALAEEGLGKYQVSIFLSLLVVILSSVAVVLNQMGLVQPERMRLLVFGELFAMLLSALLGSDRLMEGFLAIFKGKFNLDSLLTISFVVCVVDSIFCLQEIRVPYCAAFCLEMTFSLWAEFERRNTEMGQMDTMRRAIRLNRVAKAPDCYQGRPGFYVEDGEVEDFMDTYQEQSGPQKMLNLYALIALLASGAVGVVAGLKNGVSAGFQAWSMAILAAAPATAFICQTRPMAVLERRMHKLGVVLCGWSGIKAACGSNVIPLTDSDLFPGGSVKVNGVKFYSQRDPDDTVAYATALIEASGMGIAGLFTQLLDSRYGRHYEVQNFRYYENGGIGGEVCGEPVLVGSLTFLQEMGVEMPEGARVSQAVYCAVDGELSGVFAMAFGKLKGVSAALGTLCGYRGLTPVLATGNFLLSESFIRAKFNANTRRFAFPALAERETLTAWQPDPEKRTICALTTQEGLAGTAFAITGARALRSAITVGTWLHILCGVLGMAIVLVLNLVNSGNLLSPANLMILQLIWAVPGLLVTEWTRKL